MSRAEELGCELVKLSPRGTYGSGFMKAIKGQCPRTNLMPTGGVAPTEENLKGWFDAGITCVGIGSNLVSKDVIANKDFSGLTTTVKSALALIEQIRAASLL
ncbi:MAG: hypothetical protein AAF901_04175 [Bacteroidota bacterium]